MATGAEDERVCRVCRSGEEAGRLFHPCKCRGSIKFVHQHCLEQWLRHSRSRHCEVCSCAIKFTPTYADNAPTTLPWLEVALGIARQAVGTVPFALRVLVAIAAWGIVVPCCTGLVFDACLAASADELDRLWSISTPLEISLTCLKGSLVCFVIIVASLFLTTLKESIQQLPLHDNREFHMPAQQDDDSDSDGPPEDQGHGRHIHNQVHNRVQIANQIADQDEGDGEGEGEGDGEGEQDNLARGDGAQQPDAPLQPADFEDPALPVDMAAVDEEPLQVFGLAGPIANLPEWVGVALLCNAACLTVLVHIPFKFGRLFVQYRTGVLHTGVSKLYYIGVGYTVGLLAVLLGATLLVGVSTLVTRVGRQGPFRSLSAMTTALVRDMTLAGLMAKVVVLFLVELVAFPLLCGTLVDLSTLVFWNSTVQSRRAHFDANPAFSVAVHWVVGLAFMYSVGTFLQVFREFVCPYVLFFIRDPNDPNFNPFRSLVRDSWPRQMRRVLVTTLLYTAIVLMSVRVPVQVAEIFAPSLFPLSVPVTVDSSVDLPVNFLIFHVLFPLTFQRVRVKAWLRQVLAMLFRACAPRLGLHRFLLKPAKLEELGLDAGNGGVGDDGVGGEGNGGDGGARGPPARGQQLPRPASPRHIRFPPAGVTPPWVFARLVVFGSCLWAVVVVGNVGMFLVPLGVGRALIKLATDTPMDIHSFLLGCEACVLCFAGACGLYRHCLRQLQLGEPRRAVAMACVCTVFKCAVVGAVVVGPLPLLLGKLVSLAFIAPLTAEITQTAFTHPLYDWAAGVLCVKATAVSWQFGPIGGTRRFPAVWTWKLHADHAYLSGVFDIKLRPLLVRVLLPVFKVVVCSIYVPHFVFHVLLGATVGVEVASALYRLFYLGALACLGLAACWKSLLVSLDELHRRMRDERYLVTQQLHNHEPEPLPVPAAGDESRLPPH